MFDRDFKGPKIGLWMTITSLLLNTLTSTPLVAVVTTSVSELLGRIVSITTASVCSIGDTSQFGRAFSTIVSFAKGASHLFAKQSAQDFKPGIL